MQQQETLQTIPILVEEPIWKVNVGSNKIHAKRTTGRFRTIKWLTASTWLLFFLGPYLRWDNRQAVLFDIDGSQFHLFGVTVYPYDLWMLSFVLIFFAMLLVLITVLVSRAFCGYFCFQTVWTDLFSWIEEHLEGPPRARVALDIAPWGMHKLAIKLTKHSIWLIISMLTGVSFAAWFTDAYQLWINYFTLQAHISAWIVLLMFTVGTYLFAGFMREQVCFWLCPYARIQSVLYDNNTLLPTYDKSRGEPRARLDRSSENQRVGCVDCDQCLAVCPTGIDIREGEQIGCITCGLCIDACNSVMDKINQPRGLIRYDSLSNQQSTKSYYRYLRPQVLVSSVMILSSIIMISYGLSHITEAELSINPKRQPMYVVMSDGKIQNTYQLRIFNKSESDNQYRVNIKGLDNMMITGDEKPILVRSGDGTNTLVYIKVSPEQLSSKISPLTFRIKNILGKSPPIEYQSVFIAP
ncbi:MAG: cytochrome c oxidase accessory protein CcoG [Gammaproteobacteria bacterium]|nr:cytochrome c oxidase accessory protein CcoG [Gammaproteobacteria bacterium]